MPDTDYRIVAGLLLPPSDPPPASPSSQSSIAPIAQMLTDLQKSGHLTAMAAEPLIRLITTAPPSLAHCFLENTSLADILSQSPAKQASVHAIPHSSPVAAAARCASITDTMNLGIKAFLTQGGRPKHPSANTVANINASNYTSEPPLTEGDINTDNNTPGPPPSKNRKNRSSSRSSKQHTRCAHRDRNLCCISSSPDDFEAAHIIPFSIGAAKARKEERERNRRDTSSAQAPPPLDDFFWDFISMFLGPDNTVKLRSHFSQLDVAENMLLLNCQVHKYFSSGRLALIPQLTPAQELAYDSRTALEYDVLIEFPPHPNRSVPLITKAPPLPTRTVERMLAGDTITFQTEEPSRYPLPHPALLGLHAIVSRIIAARGGADVTLDMNAYDDDGDSLEDILSTEDSDSGGGRDERTWVDEWVGGTLRQRSPVFSSPPDKNMREKARPVDVVMGEMGRREEERWALRGCRC